MSVAVATARCAGGDDGVGRLELMENLEESVLAECAKLHLAAIFRTCRVGTAGVRRHRRASTGIRRVLHEACEFARSRVHMLSRIQRCAEDLAGVGRRRAACGEN